MALNSLIRSSMKRAAPLAGRLLGGQRLIHHHSPSPLFAAAAAVTPRQFAPSSFFPARNYASPAAKRPSNDQSLLEIIESEIAFAKESVEESNEVNYIICIVKKIGSFWFLLSVKMYYI